jgi:hypothetical protein
MGHGQFEFDIHNGSYLKDNASEYRVKPFINNKVIAGKRKTRGP